MILVDNEISTLSLLPDFISAQKLLDKFRLELPHIENDDYKRKRQRSILELTPGDIACFVKSHSDFVCDTIVRGILPKCYGGLESPTTFVLITDNKFDFYNITEIAKKYQIWDRVLENERKERYLETIPETIRVILSEYLRNKVKKK